MTAKAVAGLHHVTAITGDPQQNVDFYVAALGLRLVKQTVNFDDPGTYHLYYGDEVGSPGSILTFFPYVGARQGHGGAGMTESYAYAVAPSELDALRDRLTQAGLRLTEAERFGRRVLMLRDPHGQPLELVEDSAGHAHGHFFGVTMEVSDPEATARILTETFGYAEAGAETGGGASRLRFHAAGDAPGAVVDLLRRDGAPRARPGAGTIHHVAFRAQDRDHQANLREALLAQGHSVTPRVDRQYFDAVYFREPNGILFEIATDPPGFAIDEAPDALGTSLKLPPQYEPHRAQIAAHLPPLRVPA